MSAGQEVYSCDFFQHMVDHLQQMKLDEAQAFAKAYLGYEGTLSLGARDIMLPIMIPNSPYIMRNGADRRGHGVFPCYLGQNRLEIQLTLNAAKYLGVDASVFPATISTKCSLMYHEVKMTQADTLGFSDTGENTPLSTGDLPSSLQVGNITPWRMQLPRGTSTNPRDVLWRFSFWLSRITRMNLVIASNIFAPQH